VKYIAEISPVREVALLGDADLAWWQGRLRSEGLEPQARDGRAQVLLIGTSARFRGIAFRELSVSVTVTAPAGSDRQDADFLAGAYNSSRLLAWCERTFFSTPYVHGDVEVQIEPSPALRLSERGEAILSAKFADCAPGTRRLPQSDGDGAWCGALHLPSGDSGRGTSKLFFARLVGHTQTYDFAGEDKLVLRPAPNYPTLRNLVESGFTPRQWSVRAAAIHARSKTYPSPPRGAE
jgi:hypothetical protein